jgi:hypothetical protein
VATIAITGATTETTTITATTTITTRGKNGNSNNIAFKGLAYWFSTKCINQKVPIFMSETRLSPELMNYIPGFH